MKAPMRCSTISGAVAAMGEEELLELATAALSPVRYIARGRGTLGAEEIGANKRVLKGA